MELDRKILTELNRIDYELPRPHGLDKGARARQKASA
jgi:hypothetical protein